MKAYGCSAQKPWLPYEWFDTPEKLNYPGLPDYPAWYSKLKGGFGLKFSEFKECKKIFKEKGMRTFADWLRYYNNLDVAPGLEALEKMRAFYTEKGKAVDEVRRNAVCPAAAVVLEAWRENNGGVSYHRLPGNESTEVVCR